VLITAEEIESAFKMLDADGSGALTLQALKRRLGILFPEVLYVCHSSIE
jgi:Ca2+-binding EF-hand superfamily protein